MADDQSGLRDYSVNFLDGAPDPIIISDDRGRIIFANLQAAKVFGYSRGELVGASIELLLPEHFRRAHVDHRADFLSDPSARPMGAGLDLLARRKDGGEFPVDISLSPIATEDGLLVMSVIRDVTDRKKREDEIRRLNRELEVGITERTAELASERRLFRDYLDVAGVMIVALRPDGTVALINKRGCEVLGYREEEIVGKNWFEAVLPDRIRNEVKAVFEQLVSGYEEFVEYYRNQIMTKQGIERTIVWHNSLVRDEQGRVRATISSGEDITEKLLMEEQMRQADKLAVVGQLTAGLAHEIGTPLNVISGRAEYMLRKMSPDDALRTNLDSILGQIDRITRLVNQLLNFTRTRSLELRSVSLAPLIREVLSLVEHKCRDGRISVEVDCADNLPGIVADPDQLQQVLLNLLVNAIQAMPGGGRLTIRAGRTVSRRDREDRLGDHYLKIEVTDTGVGIPEENLSRVFDPFFTTKDVGKGTGLGLAVSNSIAHKHGGFMLVKSRAGEGATFSTFLPMSPRRPNPLDEAVTGGAPVHG
ncbi:MAG TPA: PAS domain S-box protein [Nitrospiria bacterium]|nr:PAS domain S-box protein [Nitrospiria bacterium]